MLSILICAAIGQESHAQGGCEVIGRITHGVVEPAESAAPLTIVPAYDPNVTAEQRAVIDQAIAEWDGVIVSAGQIANPYVIGFVNGPLGGNTLARASTSWTPSGVLNDCTITIDDDLTSIFFVDPTPAEDEEFDANGNCIATACVFSDLLTVMRHEIGHALGWVGAYGSPTNPLTVSYIFGTTFDPGRLNIAMDPLLTSHSDPAQHADDLMNPGLPSGKRRGLAWYPAVALIGRNIDHDLILRFVDEGNTSFAAGTADFPWKSAATAEASEPSGRPLLLIPGTFDEVPFDLTKARELFVSRGGTAVIH
jgi:hypothetical protein